MNGTARLRAEVPPWAVRELASALRDFDVIVEFCPESVNGCLRATRAELDKADPAWGPIRDAVRAARRTCRGEFRLNFNRLEARLSNFFTERKREMWRP